MGDIVERLDAIEARLKAARLHGGADRDVLWHASNDLTFLVAKIRRLFDVLQHGDERHQQWLREAIDAHFANQPVPAPYGAGRAESAERARDEALRRVTPVLDYYDAGLLGDGGGGDVQWWHDYIRAELARAHEFYQSQLAPSPVST